MSLYIKANWKSNNNDNTDSSGIAIFKTSDKEFTIPFDNFKDYYNLISVIAENDRLSKIETFKSLTSKLNILIQEIEHADY